MVCHYWHIDSTSTSLESISLLLLRDIYYHSCFDISKIWASHFSENTMDTLAFNSLCAIQSKMAANCSSFGSDNGLKFSFNQMQLIKWCLSMISLSKYIQVQIHPNWNILRPNLHDWSTDFDCFLIVFVLYNYALWNCSYCYQAMYHLSILTELCTVH